MVGRRRRRFADGLSIQTMLWTDRIQLCRTSAVTSCLQRRQSTVNTSEEPERGPVLVREIRVTFSISDLDVDSHQRYIHDAWTLHSISLSHLRHHTHGRCSTSHSTPKRRTEHHSQQLDVSFGDISVICIPHYGQYSNVMRPTNVCLKGRSYVQRHTGGVHPMVNVFSYVQRLTSICVKVNGLA